MIVTVRMDATKALMMTRSLSISFRFLPISHTMNINEAVSSSLNYRFTWFWENKPIENSEVSYEWVELTVGEYVLEELRVEAQS